MACGGCGWAHGAGTPAAPAAAAPTNSPALQAAPAAPAAPEHAACRRRARRRHARALVRAAARARPTSSHRAPRLPARTGRALFRICKYINKGNFGEVYEADAVGGASRRRALKRVRYSKEDKAKRSGVENRHCRRRSSCSSSTRIRTSSRITTASSRTGEFLMFLTLVDGAKSLDDAIEHKVLHAGTIGEARQRVERVLADVAAALDFCHANGVLHQDVKQENVLFGADGSAKLMDFGLASKGTGVDGALRAKLEGYTPSFDSPEVQKCLKALKAPRATVPCTRPSRRKQRLSPAEHDIYAFGAMAAALYTMKSGKPIAKAGNAKLATVGAKGFPPADARSTRCAPGPAR